MINFRRYILVIILLPITMNLVAQQCKSVIQYNEKSGLNLISIPLSVRSVVGDNISFLRLKDAGNNDAPFILWRTNEVENINHFLPFHNVQISRTDSSSTFIISNELKNRNSINFKIANNDNSKSYTIDGSNDLKQWYSIADNNLLSDIYSNDTSFVFKSIHFPSSDYAFIRTVFDDRATRPLNIMEIGDWQMENLKKEYIQIPNITYTINTSKTTKTTNVEVDKKGQYDIKKIQLYISSPNYYHRKLSISYKNKNHSDVVNYGYLNQSDSGVLNLESLQESKFNISIQNEDNAPLKIDSVAVFVEPLDILADFSAGQNYHLYIDSNYTIPIFDLADAKIAAQNFPIATVGQLQKLDAASISATKSKSKYLLFVGIFVGVLAMFFFGSKLLKDMKNEENK